MTKRRGKGKQRLSKMKYQTKKAIKPKKRMLQSKYEANIWTDTFTHAQSHIHDEPRFKSLIMIVDLRQRFFLDNYFHFSFFCRHNQAHKRRLLHRQLKTRSNINKWERKRNFSREKIKLASMTR